MSDVKGCDCIAKVFVAVAIFCWVGILGFICPWLVAGLVGLGLFLLPFAIVWAMSN